MYVCLYVYLTEKLKKGFQSKPFQCPFYWTRYISSEKSEITVSDISYIIIRSTSIISQMLHISILYK